MLNFVKKVIFKAMFKDSGQFIVNGRKVRGRMVLCEYSRMRIARTLKEDVCLFSVDGSVFMKLFDLVKYARIGYGLSQEEFRLLCLISMAKSGSVNQTDVVIFSGLNNRMTLNLLTRLVGLGFLVAFDGQKFRTKKKGISYSLSSSGLAVLEDCFRYWDDVLKFRSM